jgi:hypothetical protein
MTDRGRQTPIDTRLQAEAQKGRTDRCAALSSSGPVPAVPSPCPPDLSPPCRDSLGAERQEHGWTAIHDEGEWVHVLAIDPDAPVKTDPSAVTPRRTLDCGNSDRRDDLSPDNNLPLHQFRGDGFEAADPAATVVDREHAAIDHPPGEGDRSIRRARYGCCVPGGRQIDAPVAGLPLLWGPFEEPHDGRGGRQRPRPFRNEVRRGARVAHLRACSPVRCDLARRRRVTCGAGRGPQDDDQGDTHRPDAGSGDVSMGSNRGSKGRTTVCHGRTLTGRPVRAVGPGAYVDNA